MKIFQQLVKPFFPVRYFGLICFVLGSLQVDSFSKTFQSGIGFADLRVHGVDGGTGIVLMDLCLFGLVFRLVQSDFQLVHDLLQLPMLDFQPQVHLFFAPQLGVRFLPVDHSVSFVPFVHGRSLRGVEWCAQMADEASRTGRIFGAKHEAKHEAKHVGVPPPWREHRNAIASGFSSSFILSKEKGIDIFDPWREGVRTPIAIFDGDRDGRRSQIEILRRKGTEISMEAEVVERVIPTRSRRGDGARWRTYEEAKAREKRSKPIPRDGGRIDRIRHGRKRRKAT